MGGRGGPFAGKLKYNHLRFWRVPPIDYELADRLA
jgi:hypothetical protein